MIFDRKTGRERDLDEEIQAHLKLAEQDRIGNGESPDNAAAAARRELGNVTLMKESAREIWGWSWMDRFRQDSQYALRQLRRSPGFTAAAILSIALGIGGTTAMFTVIRAVLLKPLEYRDPERLVQLSRGVTSVRFDEMKAAARSYAELGDYLSGAEDIALSGAGEPEVLKAVRVSANFLSILGIEPMLGRSFRADEDKPGAPAAVMIGAALWRRRFGSDSNLSGKTVTLAAKAYTIAGVLPPGFQFPFSDIDVWVARPAENINTTSPMLTAFGRLTPGVTLSQANAELSVLKRQYATAHPGMLDGKPGQIEVVAPMKDQLVTNVRTMLWTLFGAVGFVLLIVCANVASLLLSRSASRSREFAVRVALGAGRARMVVQLLNESLLLGLAGGMLGVILAAWSVREIATMPAFDLPRAGEIRLDGVVLIFALLLSISSSVLFGLAPAFGASRPDLVSVLRTSGHAAGVGSSRRFMRRFNLRGLLVVAQMALSIVLLIGAGLLVQSFARLSHIDIGFNPAGLLAMRISLPPARYATETKTAAFQETLVRQVESVPGVSSAAVTFYAPMTGRAAGVPVQDASQPRLKLNERPIEIIQIVSPDYFRTLGIPLRRGREFTARDRLDAPPVAIIDENLARVLWPGYPNGTDPVGQRILLGASPAAVQIVGIVAPVHQNLEDPPWHGVYSPAAQSPQLSVGLVVRTVGEPNRFINAIRKQVLAIDPGQPISAVHTMNQLMDTELGQRRLILMLLGAFAGTALLLSVIGIYGVIAYSVAQRTTELGVRRALGAQSGDLLRQVLTGAFLLTSGGVATGICVAFALTGVMKSLLFDVSATDPATFIAIGLLFVATALVASYIPARQATRIEPMAALRVG